MNKVVVTGIGAVTPLGNTFSAAWDAAKRGISGTGRITRFDASLLPWSIAGELRDFDAYAYLSAREVHRLDPFVHYAVAAAVMAAEDAGLVSSLCSPVAYHPSLSSAGVMIGSSRGGISTIEKALVKSAASASRHSSLTPHHAHRLSPYLMSATTINMAASSVAKRLGIRGQCLGISNACASGANAIGEAFRMIRTGSASLVIAGGTEAPLCTTCVAGYGSAGALSKGRLSGNLSCVPKPFHRTRDGFVLSEGACVLVLEAGRHALDRGAPVYGEITGYGNCTDSFHITQPDPEGEARAMMMAIQEAGITTDEVDYISTHGTGTRLGDVSEVQAIKKVFGKSALNIPATAVKSMTGHMLAASGAFEVAATLMSLREGIIPPTINLDEKDPECDITVITEKKEADVRIALSNSFGFGGVNAVLVLERRRQ